MITRYENEIDNAAIKSNLERIGNQVYKALCLREEDKEWVKPLETLSIELLGMADLFPDQKNILSLACKVQGLAADDSIDFLLYRRTIFECCSLVSKIKDSIG